MPALRPALFRRTMGQRVVEGVIALHKRTGMTSADVLRDLQRIFTPSKTFAGLMEAQRAPKDDGSGRRSRKSKLLEQKIKAGHGGTLDPAASGVLVVGLGSGTKHLGTFTSCTKSYEAVVIFGASTDTYDSDCTAITHAPYEHITREMVEEALAKFRGEVKQRPPAFSALRINGKRSYDLARDGSTHEMPERTQHVSELEIVDWMPGSTHEYQWAVPKDKPTEEEEDRHRKRRNLDRKPNGKGPKPSQNAPIEPSHVREEFETRDLKANATFKAPIEVHSGVKASDASLSEQQAEHLPRDGAPIMSSARKADSAGEADEQVPKPSASVPETTPARCTGPVVRLRMTVNSGFYVRSLSHDLGKAVGSAAYMASLVRTRQGDFVLGENTMPFEDIEKGEDIWGPRVVELLDDWVKKHPHPPKNEPDERSL